MSQSLVLERAMSKEKSTLVALGYVTHPEARKRGDKLGGHIGKKNFSVDVSGMLVVKLIPSKKEKILKQFPQIKKQGKFWQCEYTWIEENDDSFSVKWHPSNVSKYGEHDKQEK